MGRWRYCAGRGTRWRGPESSPNRYIESLVVDEVELVDQPIRFDWTCPSTTLVISLGVRVRASGVEAIKCEVPWDSDSLGWPDSNVACSARTVDIEAIAAKKH